MTPNDSKSCLPYLNKLVDQYNNTYYHSIYKKPINPDYSAYIENVETNSKAPKFKLNDRVKSIRIFLVKLTVKIGQEKYLLSIRF